MAIVFTKQAPSSKGTGSYTVALEVVEEGSTWSCECMGFKYRGQCRHITKAMEEFDEEETCRQEVEDSPDRFGVEDDDKIRF